MKIVGILGSPRKGGNTETLLDLALGEAQKKSILTEKIVLRDKSIAPCDGCHRCTKTGKCVIKDDAQEIYRSMLDADGIIWATPVYFWSMSSHAKILMDRTFSLTYPTLQLASKVGGLILVARNRGCMNTANLFNQYFAYNHMFFTEFAWGYALKKGEIKKDAVVTDMTLEMVHQMIALINAHLEFPQEFDSPIHRVAGKKHNR